MTQEESSTPPQTPSAMDDLHVLHTVLDHYLYFQ